MLPSYPALAEVSRILAGTGVSLGAQNLAADDFGAQTGEVTGAMLVELGCRYVTVGHAERRSRFGESDDVVAAKIAAAFRHGLTPVLCVGETDHRTATRAISECIRQLNSALTVARGTGTVGRVLVAYEPVWAIGQAKPAPEEHILAVIEGIRGVADGSSVIYGGSAQPGLLSRLAGGVDGLFLGRFAHDPLALAAVVEEAEALTAGANRAAPVTIGLGTYAFFWQWHQTAETPLSLTDMVDRTADLGVGLFQICDYPLFESYDSSDLDQLRVRATKQGVRLELGTRGVRPAHLRRYLEMARRLDATLVRSMINTADHRPSPDEAVELLRSVAPGFEEAGVTVALETYEQVPVNTLVDIVTRVGSPAIGICVDPGNCVAALELPTATVEAVAPYARNIHVKDFAFSRRDGWVGFTLAGCPLGEGLLDYQHLITTTHARERGLSQIIEHWLPWQGDSASTIRTENDWNLHNLDYLRSQAA